MAATQEFPAPLMTDISATARLLRGLVHGAGLVVGDFCILGTPPAGFAEGELGTVIGDHALIRSHTVIYAGNIIGNQFTTGHGVLVRECNTIGNRVSIGSHSIVEHHVQIGDRVRIHSGAFIPEFSVLEDDAWIGPHVVFTNVLHPLCPEVSQCIKGPRIGRGAKIGAGARVLPAVEIGEMAMIGAGAVVTASVPARAVAVGNPARVVKMIDDITCPWDYIAHPYPPPPGADGL